MITSAQLIEAAELVKTIEAGKVRLAALLAGATDGVTAASPVVAEVTADGRKKRGPLSPEAKKAIRLGQKRRWAKVHAAEAAKAGTSATTVTIPTPAATPAATVKAATSEQVLATA